MNKKKKKTPVRGKKIVKRDIYEVYLFIIIITSNCGFTGEGEFCSSTWNHDSSALYRVYFAHFRIV